MNITRTEIEKTMSRNALKGISTDYNKRAPKIKVNTADLKVLATAKVESLLKGANELEFYTSLYSPVFDFLRTARRLEIRANVCNTEVVAIRKSDYKFIGGIE